MMFTWSFLPFYDIPGLGKYGISCNVLGWYFSDKCGKFTYDIKEQNYVALLQAELSSGLHSWNLTAAA